MKFWSGRLLYLAPLAAAALIIVVLNTTSPRGSGPAGILLVLVLMYIMALSCIFLVLRTGMALFIYIFSLSYRLRSLENRRNVSIKRAYYMASILAFVPVFVIGMRTIGQLQVRDVALVFLLVAMACFYVAKRVR